MSRGTWLSAAALALLVGVATGGPATARPMDPADLPEPTSSQLADSVRVWDPAETVRVWDPEGTVSTLEQETTDGGETVLRLDTDILFAFDSAEPPPTAGPAIAALLQDVPSGAAVTILGTPTLVATTRTTWSCPGDVRRPSREPLPLPGPTCPSP
jgi:hypothetical protein